MTKVRFTVSDVERIAKESFVSEFELIATPGVQTQSPRSDTETESPDRRPNPNQSKSSPSLRLPEPISVKKDKWSKGYGIDGKYDAFRIKSAPNGGYDWSYPGLADGLSVSIQSVAWSTTLEVFSKSIGEKYPSAECRRWGLYQPSMY